jgi:hypothetical protein
MYFTFTKICSATEARLLPKLFSESKLTIVFKENSKSPLHNDCPSKISLMDIKAYYWCD